MTTRTVRHLATIAVVALLVAACGGTRDDSSTSTESTGETATSPTGDTAFGDLPSPCGPGDDTGADTTYLDQGVTADEVVIGYGDDAGYQANPGLNHEMSDAVAAMIDWCNEQGGINGRTVVGNYYDAKILEAATVMQEACGEVFMLVGQGFALDDSSEQARLGCGLPTVPTYTGSAQMSMAPLKVQPVPTPTDHHNTQQAYALAEAFPDEVTKAAAIFPPLPASVNVVEKVRATYPAAGFEFLDCDQQYQLSGEADWKPFAQRLKDCGAEAVYYSGAELNLENLLDAANQVDYHPIWFVESGFYTDSFAAWNQNGNADAVYVKNAVAPLFRAEDSPATATYIELVEGSGGEVSALGAQAASAFLLWATAADECGADLSRDCVMDALYDITTWDGGGLHAPTNPGGNLPSECASVLLLDGTDWAQWSPSDGALYGCAPEFLAEVVPAPSIQAELDLDEDRMSRLHAVG